MNPPSNHWTEVGQADFRLEVLRRLDRIEDRQVVLEREVKEHHEENREKWSSYEALTDKIQFIADEWFGREGDHGGMRHELKEMITRERNLTWGWRVLMAIGTFVAGASAVLVAFIDRWHK